jgi:hypothetical protein
VKISEGAAAEAFFMIILGVLLLFSLSTARGAEDGSEDNEANIDVLITLKHV